VTLFFVLSGFLITGILLDTRGQKNYLRDFFARRSLRIFPLYFAFLAVYLLVVPHVREISEQLPQPKPEMQIYYWTYTANMKEWLSGGGGGVTPLDPLWSLSVEEQVYLFWPFLILLVPRRWLLTVFVGIALASAGWRFVSILNAQSIEISSGWAPANFEAFAAGAIVALFSRGHTDVLRIWAPRLAMASAFFISGMWAGQRHFNYWEGPAQMLTVGTTALIVFFAATIGLSVTSSDQSLLNKALSVSWLRLVGKYSYAIYVFHASIILLLSPIVFSQRTGIIRGEDALAGLLFTAGVAVCSFIAACLSWYAWESQFLRLKQYFPLSGSVIRAEAEIEGSGLKAQGVSLTA
jgi:peptidoglycan/LPS O-acetylase OafA/YrhL